MSGMQNQSQISDGNKAVDLHQYFKIRTRDKKYSLDINVVSSNNLHSPHYSRDGLVFSSMMNNRVQTQKFETINELEEHKTQKENEEQQHMSNSTTEISNISNQAYNSETTMNDNSKTTKIRMINFKKQSVELRPRPSDMFLDIKSNSSSNQYNSEIYCKVRRQQKYSTRLSCSLDSLFTKSINYQNIITSEAQQSYYNSIFKRNNNQQTQTPNSRIYEDGGNSNINQKRKRISNSVDEILWRRKNQTLVSQLDNLPQRKWALIKESSSLFYLSIKSKIAQVKTKRASCEVSKFLPIIEMMSEYYSRQFLNCIKCSSNHPLNDIVNGQHQMVPQFFTQETAAKYILKHYKNRNILKKNYLEEIYKSKEGQIQFKECCLEGKCVTNGNKNPHVNKIKCINKYLLLYRAFQDESFFNELVINTYDFLISNHELFTQMVCFFFFNDNVSFNRQFKCLEFCLKWIKKRPFTFSENQDLFYKMKEFIAFIKLKYNTLQLDNDEHKHSLIPCKCDSYLKNSNNSVNQNSIDSLSNLTVQSPLLVQKSDFIQNNLKQYIERDSLDSQNEGNSLMSLKIGSSSYANNLINSNTNSLNTQAIHENYDSTHISLAARSEKRRGPPPALARYNNVPNSSPTKKLLSKIILNEQQQQQQQQKKEIEESQQIGQCSPQIQTIENKTISIPNLKDTRGATSSIYVGSQAATAYTYRLQGENVIFSQTESSGNINTFKSLFSERKESNDSMFLPQMKSSNSTQVKSMINTVAPTYEDIRQTLPPKNAFISTNNLTSSLHYEQQSTNNSDNPYQQSSQSNMSKSLQLPQRSSLTSKKTQVEQKYNSNRLTHKDSILEEEILESQESSYISSQSSGPSRDKSQSASALASTIQSLQIGIQNQNSNITQNSSNTQKSQKRKQSGSNLTLSEMQVKELTKKINQMEATINYRVVQNNESKSQFQQPCAFSCLSQEQLQHIQEKWEIAMKCRYYERLNTQILKEKFSYDIFNQFDIDIIAQQICLIDHSLYCNINIYEFFSDKRLKSFNLFSQHSSRKNLSLVKKRFNLFTYFIIFMVLLQPSTEETKFLYEKLLELSEKALEYQNYNLALQIYSSFNSSIIYEKIKQVHEKSSLSTKKRFTTLEKAIEFNRSFNALKEAMHKAKPPLVPALNIITRDLTLLDQHKDDFIQVQNQPQIDLVKFEEISKITQIFFTVKTHNYPFIIYPAVYDFFCNSYEKFMAQYIDMKDSTTIEFKLSEFSRKNTSIII